MFRLSRQFLQFFFALLFFIGVGFIIYIFYLYFSTRLYEEVRIEAQNRISVFASSIRGDILRYIIVPEVIANDKRIAASLIAPNIVSAQESLKLENVPLQDATLFTVNTNGIIVESSNDEEAGTPFIYQDILAQAFQLGQASYYDLGEKNFVHLVRIEAPVAQLPVGALGIKFSFSRYADIWSNTGDNIFLTNAEGEILFSQDPSLTGSQFQDYVGVETALKLNEFNSSTIYNLNGNEMLIMTIDVGINGWKLAYLVPIAETRQTLRGYMALVVLAIGFIIITALFAFSRRAVRNAVQIRRESENLRALNARLLTEIEQRHQAERKVQVAEQSMEQSAKLAAVGQMSAAVGHELNQPLAAMRTYLSGARKLIARGRFQEGAQSLNRIEDLLERMGSITRQMRSFARVQENHVAAFDLNTALMNAFALMAPQFGQSKIKIERNIPEEPLMVEGDMMRTEQIIVNLLRNAVDAVSGLDAPEIDISLEALTHRALLKIGDNGTGFEDSEKLFEPFYTTKPPGDGLGLGLAISASYARDMGGILRAHKREPQGSVFELQIPLASHIKPDNHIV